MANHTRGFHCQILDWTVDFQFSKVLKSLTNSDFPTKQTFHQFHDLDTDFDLHRITSGFHGAFATGVACQQGTLTLSDTWFRSPFWDLLMLQLLRPNSSNLPCPYSAFHLEYPLVLSRFCLWIFWPFSVLHMFLFLILPHTLLLRRVL